MTDQVSKFRVPINHSSSWQPQQQQQPNPQKPVDIRHAYGPKMPDFDQVDHNYMLHQFWCLTHYYNPLHFKSRIDNFINFYNHIIGQCPNLLVMELAITEDDFILHNWVHENNLVQIVDTTMIWQKERCFNLALQWLPDSCTKVAWVDCDVLCSDDDWAWKTSRLLEDYKVVQPYFQNARLPIDISCIDYGVNVEVFPYGWNDETRSDGDIHSYYKVKTNMRPWKHPGYLYAYRRDLLDEHGFYDRCPAGSSDNMMSQAMLGQFNNKDVIMAGGYNTESLLHYWKWAIPLAEEVAGSIQFLRSNDVFHLYHGRTNNRQYLSRLEYLMAEGFDHGKDLFVNDDTGLYEFTSEKQHIKDWLNGYYHKRNDDEHRTNIADGVPA